MTQGTRSNLTGLALENMIKSYCQYYGLVANSRFDFGRKNLFGNSTMRVPIYASPCSAFPLGLGIECMAQPGNGSATWKIPGKVWNIVECYPFPGAIVLWGDSPEMMAARDWAKNQIMRDWHTNGRSGNLLGVFTPKEFRVWLRDSVKAGTPAPFTYGKGK